MKEKVVLLTHLQEVDNLLLSLKKRREIIPERILELEIELEQYQIDINTGKERLIELEKERKEKDIDLKDEEESLIKSESKLSEVKTNKEYEAALKEIVEHKKKNSMLEEQTLKLMEEFDTLQQEIARKETELKEKSVEIDSDIESLKKKADEIEKELKLKEKERSKISIDIDPAHLMKYERLGKMKINNSVVRVKKGVCGGCFMNLPPQLYNEMQRDQDLKICPNCNRLIYWQEDEKEKA